MKSLCFGISQLVLLSMIVSANAEEVKTIMQLTSTSFEDQASIAKKYTCDGENISPALDIALPDLRRPTKAELEKAMHGHVLSKAELMGLYQRK